MSNTESETTNNKKLIDEELENELKNAKLQFGDKLIDPSDRRIRKPHSRIVGPFAGHSDHEANNSGGLLKTGDHRPTGKQQ